MSKKKIILKNGDARDGDTLVRSQYSGDDDRFDTVEGVLKEDPYGVLKVHLKDGSTENIYAFHPDWVIKPSPEKILEAAEEEEQKWNEVFRNKTKKQMEDSEDGRVYGAVMEAIDTIKTRAKNKLGEI